MADHGHPHDVPHGGPGPEYGAPNGEGYHNGGGPPLDDHAQAHQSQGPPKTEDNFEGKIFVGGISWQTTEDGLKYYFEKFGELSDVALMRDKMSGNPRGFGFVTFKDPAGEFTGLRCRSLCFRLVLAGSPGRRCTSSRTEELGRQAYRETTGRYVRQHRERRQSKRSS